MAVQNLLKDEVKQALREEGGAWLKSKREAAGLSQKGMAKALSCMFTFISQLEQGRGRVPPDRYLDWALALQLDPRDFVCTILFYYEPLTYEIIFKNPRPSGAAAI